MNNNDKKESFIDKLGLKFKSIFSNKTIDELKKEAEGKEIVDKMNEEHSKLLERLNKEELTREEIDSIITEYEVAKQNALSDMDELLKSDIIKDKEEMKEQLDNAIKESDERIEAAKNKAMERVNKLENKEDSSVKPVLPVYKAERTPIKAQTLTAVEDDAPTAIPEQEPEVDLKVAEPELEIQETPLDEPAPEIAAQDITVPEMEEPNKPEIEEPYDLPELEKTKEMPAVDTGEKNIRFERNGSNRIDIRDCSDWYDYVEKFFVQSGIGIENVHNFYKDIDRKLYPIGFLSKEEFAVEKQKVEDEIEYKKLQTERAKIEKRLRELDEKYTEAREEIIELEAKMSKISTLRRENNSLKEIIVEKESQIKDKESENTRLKGQVKATQEIADKAQAKSYEDRKLYEEVEKENSILAEEIKKLKKQAAESEKTAGEATRKAEELQKEVNKKISAAVEQIKGLSRPDDDDIDKAIIRDLEEKFNKQIETEEKEQKKSPKHFAKAKEKHMDPKEEKKIAPVIDLPKSEETKKQEPEIEITEVEPQIIEPTTLSPEVQEEQTVTDFKQDDELKTQIEDLEAKKADLIEKIKEEAGENNNSEGTKTR